MIIILPILSLICLFGYIGCCEASEYQEKNPSEGLFDRLIFFLLK